MFPLHRGRRLRTNESIRSLVRETTLSPSDFMFPMFITEGENIKEVIQLAVDSGESQTIRALSSGFNEAGELIAEFWITWSFKRRS